MLRPHGPPARLVVVDPNRAIANLIRLTLQRHGFGDPHLMEEAEEALDLLGAMAQAIDLVLMAYSADPETVDLRLLEVLRRVGSPVRLACYGALTPDDCAPDVRRLIGAAAYLDMCSTYGIARAVRDLLAAPVAVAQILSSSRVPATMSRPWALAIYDAAPDETFARARLDTLN